MKAQKVHSSLDGLILTVIVVGMMGLMLVPESEAQTPEEWAAIAEEHLRKDPPAYYDAGEAYERAGKAAYEQGRYNDAIGYYMFLSGAHTVWFGRSI